MSLRVFFLCSLLIAICSLLPAIDFGLVVDQNAEFSGEGNGTAFDYSGIVIPRLSGIWGSQSGFYFSVGLSYDVDPLNFVPELLLTDIYLRSDGFEFRMGRMQYIDPLGFIASGLFDGLQFLRDSAAGTFSFGVWYTGLLYKRRANIEMTFEEQISNNTALDYDDFVNSYFAPRRVLGALEWTHQGLGERVLASLALLGQFDIAAEDQLHSQYLIGKLMIPAGRIIFNLGGCFEFLQFSGEPYSAYAAEAGIAWQSRIQRFGLLGRLSSGHNDSTVAFLPINSVSQSEILGPKLSGISLISLDYTARLHRTFSLGFSSYYFILNDLYSADWESDLYYEGRSLGAEFYGGLYWSPLSDLSINFGAGAFLPSLGNAAPDAGSLWSLKLNVVISFI